MALARLSAEPSGAEMQDTTAVASEGLRYPKSAANGLVGPGRLDSGVRIVHLPKIADNRGNLTFIENSRHIPFQIERVYYLYDVPAGAARGGHAHKQLQQFIIAASGSFTVVIDDGFSRNAFFLNRPHYGLYIPRMVWRELEDFSSGSICVVLASEKYDESDYYREYDEFRSALRAEQSNYISRPAGGVSRT